MRAAATCLTLALTLSLTLAALTLTLALSRRLTAAISFSNLTGRCMGLSAETASMRATGSACLTKGRVGVPGPGDGWGGGSASTSASG